MPQKICIDNMIIEAHVNADVIKGVSESRFTGLNIGSEDDVLSALADPRRRTGSSFPTFLSAAGSRFMHYMRRKNGMNPIVNPYD